MDTSAWQVMINLITPATAFLAWFSLGAYLLKKHAAPLVALT